MIFNFELLNMSKMTILKIYDKFEVMEKLEISNLDSRETSLRGFHWTPHLRS